MSFPFNLFPRFFLNGFGKFLACFVNKKENIGNFIIGKSHAFSDYVIDIQQLNIINEHDFTLKFIQKHQLLLPQLLIELSLSRILAYASKKIISYTDYHFDGGNCFSRHQYMDIACREVQQTVDS